MVQKCMEIICSFKKTDAKFYASDYYYVNENKCSVKYGTLLRFLENRLD